MSYVITLVGYVPSPRYDGIPWTKAQIAYSSSENGTFSTFDTLTLSPVDTDPTTPQTRNLTTSLAPAPTGWFQVTFLDAQNDEEPTDPVQVADSTAVQFASHDDLANRLGVTFSAAEQKRADYLLQLASSMIQRECKQTIVLVTDDVLTRPGTADEDLRLPERPVQSVSSVVLNGVTLVQGTDYVLVSDVLSRLNTAVIADDYFYVLYPDDGWGDPSQTLVVTYTHGYTTIPAEVQAISMEAVVRAWVNPGNVLEERYGPEMVVYQQRSGTAASLTGLLLTEDEKRILHDTIRRTAGSTALR